MRRFLHGCVGFLLLHASPSLLQGANSADSQPASTNTPAAAAAGPPGEPNSSNQQQQDIIQQQQQQTDMQQDEGRQVSRLVLRTVFFDEATLLVTGRPAPRSDTVLAAVAAHIQQHKLQPCRQVRQDSLESWTGKSACDNWADQQDSSCWRT
jgi:hypothetical protein